MKKHLKNLINLLLGWVFGTFAMLFMPIFILLGYEYDIEVKRK